MPRIWNTLWAWLLLGLVQGCHAERQPNTAWLFGARVAPAKATVGEAHDAGTVGEVGTRLVVANTVDTLTQRGDLDLWIGGNGEGPAGRVALAFETGGVAGDGPSHPFLRLGLAGDVESNPYDGWLAFELPTLTAGYQFHGRGTESFSDTLHFELAPRAGFGIAGRAVALDTRADFVAAPDLGITTLLLGEFIAFEATYIRFFESEPIDVAKGLGCFASLIAVCADGRIVRARFGSPTMAPEAGVAWTAGVSFGFGWASGKALRPGLR